MNTTTQRNFSETRHLTYSHTFDYTEMHFNHKLWAYFPYKQIENRLISWAEAAQGDYFRQPTSWELLDELVVQLLIYRMVLSPSRNWIMSR